MKKECQGSINAEEEQERSGQTIQVARELEICLRMHVWF